jgi:hypothetical protein
MTQGNEFQNNSLNKLNMTNYKLWDYTILVCSNHKFAKNLSKHQIQAKSAAKIKTYINERDENLSKKTLKSNDL